MRLYQHQTDALEKTKDFNKVAYYHDMGLGKTFTGSEKMISFNTKMNLIVCQKSKINDWIEHFKEYYPNYLIRDLTKSKDMEIFTNTICDLKNYPELEDTKYNILGVINYDLIFRRKQLLELNNFTLMLDESSMIQNETAKRSKFILKMKPKNVILLSGTPTGGKYERLWSQMKLLGWNISKDLYWRQYIDVEIIDNEGFPIKIVKGYKNVERLKQKMRDYGAHFLKSNEVFNLPNQINNIIRIQTTKEYRKFKRTSIVTVEGIEIVGDTILTKMLYERQLCGQYNDDKFNAFSDILGSTDDRLIVFYNFKNELEQLKEMAIDRPISIVSGDIKNLEAYETHDNSITFIQYQAGAMGLNLQKANKIIYFTPPLSSELFEQSKKRTHRIGQTQTCYYYYLICKNSIEEKIYDALEKRKDYTENLFKQSN